MHQLTSSHLTIACYLGLCEMCCDCQPVMVGVCVSMSSHGCEVGTPLPLVYLPSPTILYFTMSPSEVVDYMCCQLLDFCTGLEATSIDATSAEYWMIHFMVLLVQTFFLCFLLMILLA